MRGCSALGRQKAQGWVTPGHPTTAPAPPSPLRKGSDRPELTRCSSVGWRACLPLLLPLGQRLLSPLPEAPCRGHVPRQSLSPTSGSATLPSSTSRGVSARDTHRPPGMLSTAVALLTPLKFPND